MLVGRVVAASCVVALLGAAVTIGMAWGWADHGHGAAASVPVASAGVAVSAGVAAASASGAVAPLATPASAPAGSVAPVSAEPDWLAVLSGLDRSRDAAFADADANELDAVYVPGSAALATDRATLGRLVGAGQRVRGLQFVLESVRLVSQSSGEVTLAVVDTLAGYDVVDAAGVATPVAGRGARKWTVVLCTRRPTVSVAAMARSPRSHPPEPATSIHGSASCRRLDYLTSAVLIRIL